MVIDGSGPHLDRFFTYRSPDQCIDQVQVGQYLRVPWGKKARGAFVAALRSQPPEGLNPTDIKNFESILNPQVVVGPVHWRLADWLRTFYFGTWSSAIQCVIPGPVLQGLRRSTKSRVKTDNDAFEAIEVGPELTEEQQEAWNRLEPQLGLGKTFLLHGVTGSGKTEIYLRATAACLARGQRALVLVPEVALTPQTQARYRNRFGSQVSILHSGLTGAQRRQQWWRIAKDLAHVVVGTRSAIFAPLRDCGLIVIDEEHDSSYKQGSEIRYHARQVAAWLSRETQATVLLGSATPSLESYTLAQKGRYELLELRNRISGRQLPHMKVMKGTGIPHLALQALAERKAKGEQSVLLLNRRGYSNYLQCYHCGWVPQCKSCSISLTFHQGVRSVRCHYCGASHPAPSCCQDCGGAQLEYPGRGTERVEQELKSRLPELRVARLDRDTVGGKASVFSETFAAFEKGEVDCLLGTQMVAKGLDFPKVTLVLVLDADTGLHLPDFRASERTFALLTQVAGRSGRGEAPGEVILVCRKPEQRLFQQLLKHSWAEFMEQEQISRRDFRYPPYSRLLRLLLSDENLERLESFADKLALLLERATAETEIEVMGPAPCPLEKLQGRYRWHVLLRAPRVQDLQDLVRNSMANLEIGQTRLSYDPDPLELL